MLIGGDTDTNCAIVGGMVGAMVGVEKIDNHFLVTCLESDMSEGEVGMRPDFVNQSKGCIDDIIRLNSIAPESLTLLNMPKI